MFAGKFFLLVIVMTIAITCIQWFFTGFLFHKYQASTPATWRKESKASYAWSTVIALFFSFMFSLLFSLWKNKSGLLFISDGIEFGTLVWLCFAIPYEIGTALYVNYSRLFVVGRCLSSLVEYVVAGVLAAWLL
jgi:hypothetical protein